MSGGSGSGCRPGRRAGPGAHDPREREDHVNQVKREARAEWRSIRPEQQKEADLAKSRELKRSLDGGQELCPDGLDKGPSWQRDVP